MSERDAPRFYGMWAGLMSGLFAIGQVAVSVASAQGSEAALRAIQRALNIYLSGGLADPTVLITPLIPMLVTTYLSMVVCGLLTLWFAAQAGRLAAMAQGRHAGGATAGMWVWLVSTLMWLAGSVVATLITNTDGTISGVFTGTFTRAFLPQELLFLLLQEVVAALISLGFCAMAGARGARNAPLVAPSTAFPPFPTGQLAPVGFTPPGAYPYAPYPMPGYPPRPAGYPGYPGYPSGPWGAPQAPYPGMVMYPQPTAPQPMAPQPTAPQLPTMPQQPTVPLAQVTGPIPYPPPPSFYVPQVPQQAPTAQGEMPAPMAPQPAE